ncbi:MAG TPA: beta-ribofuranosylaminobenzene 5'-phosphate synthase [Methanospirillum sp.]|uniref:beta-ribofuranosylaminobenzene 5'-phosphate synthase n=1 Tax=Methanospirillum sp. TaxID=45200 RepID=UPI002BE4B180|nr:beta-ribofuranosylaminobenzene 5'-phosphate synthase [Methanospirillum sp.]HOJ95425.1 beta-ribofuranosylaminobenzene 5'-phosphate synthase [Methanospirillum sp.]
MTQASVLELIQKIEHESGQLTKPERALLITDGSVTRLLEAFGNAPVGVRTIQQNILPVPEKIAEFLEISPGDDVNFREVDLYNKNDGRVLIHAISYAPLKHLPTGAITRLIKEDEPIGMIMRDEKMESRREILSIRKITHPSDDHRQNTREKFQLSRSYRIIHNSRPIFYIEEQIPLPLFTEDTTIKVITPSRLHIGLLDMNGGGGRVDGGAGITLADPGFIFEISKSDAFSLTSEEREVAHQVQPILDKLIMNGLSIPPVHIHIQQSIPFHSGLGSGTQAALGIAAGIGAMTEQKLSAEELIALSGRGGTSGIGIRAFFMGGLLVDAGHRFGPGRKKDSFAPSASSSGAGAAPLVGRYAIPEDWHFILAIPDGFAEIHGQLEYDMFQRFCPVPQSEVQALSHILLMKLIPSVIEEDLEQFGEAINEFQNYGFKKCEISLQPPVIMDTMDAMRDAGAAGAGMSSFGPVVYGVCDSNTNAIRSAVQNIMNQEKGGRTVCTKGRNSGVEVIKNGHKMQLIY